MERIKISSSLTMSRLVYGMWRLSDDKNTYFQNHIKSTHNVKTCFIILFNYVFNYYYIFFKYFQ